MRWSRLFSYAMIATVLADAAALLTHLGPEPTMGGRVVACFLLGFLFSRTPTPPRVVAATAAGVLAGTVLTLTSYVRTGAALQQPNFVGHLGAILATSALVALGFTSFGIVAGRLAGRAYPRRAA